MEQGGRPASAGTLGRIRWFLAGDPPSYPPGAAERRVVDLLGLRIPLHSAAVLLFATGLVLLNRAVDFLPAYGQLDPRSVRDKAIERLVLFGMAPLLALLALREDPRRYGLGVGDARRGLPLLGILLAVTLPTIVLTVVLVPELRTWYAPQYTSVPDVLATNLLELVAAEFLLRGVVLFALVRAIGPLGVVVAVVPFVFQHVDKPLLEALSTLGGGLVFGWLNWRTGSIWYSAAYHIGLQATAIIAAGLLPG